MLLNCVLTKVVSARVLPAMQNMTRKRFLCSRPVELTGASLQSDDTVPSSVSSHEPVEIKVMLFKFSIGLIFSTESGI